VSLPPMDAASRIAALSPRSPRTVEVHRAILKRRLGARNVAEAIRVAYEVQSIRQRLFPRDEPQQAAAHGELDRSTPELCDPFLVFANGRSRTG
jgi:hypothetical protein